MEDCNQNDKNLVLPLNNESKADEFVMAVVPLRGMVMFPNMILHFDVGRRKAIMALEDSMRTGQYVMMTTQNDSKIEDPDSKDLYKIGISSKVKQIIHQPGGIGRAFVVGASRAEIVEVLEERPFIRAKVKILSEIPPEKNITNKAVFRHARDMFSDYLRLSPRVSPDLALGAREIKDPGQLADFIASNISFDLEEKQNILEELNQELRLERLLVLLAHEFDIIKIENELAGKLRNAIEKHQREYFLREQMKVISAELGDEDSPSLEADKYKKKLRNLNLSKENNKKFLDEIDRFAKMPSYSMESGLFRNYIEFCLALPWNKVSKDSLDLDRAEKILDKEHYALKEVKEKVTEFLATKILSKSPAGQILCLIGPPGIGKTSVIESLAKAMKRKFARISLGGVSDESEIRGHRKTYIGASCGKIIAAIKRLGVKNPVILLDEIDKMGKSFHGDPAAALLEALDPSQNKKFNDHYVDLDFDLSEVFFVATANDKAQIPAPLLDRVEVINLYSYTHEEKFNIAKKFLIPKQLIKNGLKSKDFCIKSQVLKDIIDGYTREAGVRDLERKIAVLMRKAAKKIVIHKSTHEGNISKIEIDTEELKKELGPRKFKKNKEQKSEVGVVRGLAWTVVGGETMPIEVSLMKGKGKVEVTGSLGDVMKESAKLAVSYIRCNSDKFGIKNNFYSNYDIHIHAPEGAVPKDGPSAGVTMTTALVSALSKTPVRQDVAMTGEITLKGRVLAIGGLKEKTMAAYKAGVKTVIIPAENECDLVDVDSVVKDAIEFVKADNLDTVLKVALVDSPSER
ncbi:MAG: endopeptidase La [Candidatus Improbicoccus devescovinae]|nr:MAG: endopeptidase La [Candidatus Improbicoccus devescovinae]